MVCYFKENLITMVMITLVIKYKNPLNQSLGIYSVSSKVNMEKTNVEIK